MQWPVCIVFFWHLFFFASCFSWCTLYMFFLSFKIFKFLQSLLLSAVFSGSGDALPCCNVIVHQQTTIDNNVQCKIVHPQTTIDLFRPFSLCQFLADYHPQFIKCVQSPNKRKQLSNSCISHDFINCEDYFMAIYHFNWKDISTESIYIKLARYNEQKNRFEENEFQIMFGI